MWTHWSLAVATERWDSLKACQQLVEQALPHVVGPKEGLRVVELGQIDLEQKAVSLRERQCVEGQALLTQKVDAEDS